MLLFFSALVLLLLLLLLVNTKLLGSKVAAPKIGCPVWLNTSNTHKTGPLW